LELLTKYAYPGNVRELKNIVVGSYYSTAKTLIGISDLPPEVRCEDSVKSDSESSAAEHIYREILDGRGDFENLVKQPFRQRRFGSSLVRSLIQMALEDSGGKYRDALSLLRVPDTRYSVTLQFLKRNKCYVDFRPYRLKRRRIDPPG
jgi:DNA-binding NtrC family response regulator